MRVSLVLTVLNEAASIDRLLESVAAQTRAVEEIVVADGGSRDGTTERLRAWQDRLPLRLIEAPGANISQGRNRAIEAASGPIIAVTDAGVRLDERWLEELVRPLEEWHERGARGLSPVACGAFRADPGSPFELALGATTLPLPTEIVPTRFLPSSRSVAFLKEAWASVGGYPEWLDYCEDLVFDLKLKERGHPFVFVPHALAHFRPRESLRAFFRQYFRYARGDGKADLWRLRHAIRYGSYLVGAALALAGLRTPALWSFLLVGGAAYLFRPYRRLLALGRERSPGWLLQAFPWPPLIRLTGDVAKMLGYPVGVWWRWRQRGGRGWRAER